MKKIILSIAGSDPSGGAGIQADIRTADRIGVYPCSVVTAITAQNTSGVEGIWPVGERELKTQLKTLLNDIRPDAVKIGLVESADLLKVIVEAIQEFDLNNIVVDPVLAPSLSSKEPDKELATAYIRELFPLAILVTPNIPEKDYFESVATGLAGADKIPFEDLCEAFLLKGGHMHGKECVDTLYYHSLYRPSSDFQSTAFPTLNNNTQPFLPGDLSPLSEDAYNREVTVREFSHKRLDTANTHGSGCVLSTAIACYLAQDYHLEKGVEAALKFTYNAMRESARYKLGKGSYGPTIF